MSKGQAVHVSSTTRDPGGEEERLCTYLESIKKKTAAGGCLNNSKATGKKGVQETTTYSSGVENRRKRRKRSSVRFEEAYAEIYEAWAREGCLAAGETPPAGAYGLEIGRFPHPEIIR